MAVVCHQNGREHFVQGNELYKGRGSSPWASGGEGQRFVQTRLPEARNSCTNNIEVHKERLPQLFSDQSATFLTSCRQPPQQPP